MNMLHVHPEPNMGGSGAWVTWWWSPVCQRRHDSCSGELWVVLVCTASVIALVECTVHGTNRTKTFSFRIFIVSGLRLKAQASKQHT